MAIVKDIEQIHEVITVHTDLSYDQLKPSILDVEPEYILPILGKELYAELEEDLLEEDKQELVDVIARAVIVLAFNKAIPYLNVGISGNGLTVSNTTNEAPASQVRTEDLKLATLTDGHNRLDSLIGYIEQHNDIYNIDLTEYYGSISFFVSSARAMTKYAPIRNNRFVFLNMLSVLRETEENVLAEVLGVELYDEVIASFKSENGLAEKYSILKEKSAAVLSYFTFAEALIEIGLLVDSRGVTIFNNNYAQTTEVRLPADGNNVTALQNKYLQKGTRAIEKLVKYLHDNINDFEAFKSSEKYEEDPDPSGSFSPISPNENIIF